MPTASPAKDFSPTANDLSAMAGPRRLFVGPFQSGLLDLSRWVAALLVVVEHMRSLMFHPYGNESSTGILGRAFYFITGFGHAAVMVFFVMSGFLVGGKVIEQLAHGTFSWQKYLVARGTRLYAVYLLALLLGGALDYFGYHHLNRFGLYNQSFSGSIAVVNHNFHASLTPLIFGLNLVMCQTILGPVFGSNGPLWSLANEFWYYLLGPVLFGLFYQKRPSHIVFGLVALAASIWFLPASMLLYFLVWILGAMLYFVNLRAWLPTWISLLGFLGCFSVARLQVIKMPFVADFLIAVSFALLINSATGKARALPGQELNRTAADFSYSVYLCHFPFLVLVLSALNQFAGIGLQDSRTLFSAVLFLGVLGSAYLWCYLISLVTERQTPRIRRWVYQALGRMETGPGAKVG